MKILCIFAHPDDFEIYAIGSAIRLINKDINVHLAIATTTFSIYTEERKAEAHKAIEGLKMTLSFLGFPDGQIKSSNVNCYKEVEKLVLDYKPDLIFTHSESDYHSDHVNLAKIVKDIASFKVPVLFSDTLNGQESNVSIYIDITEQIDEKCMRLSYHKSQCEKAPYINIVKIVNNFRGLQYSGDPLSYCEAFTSSVYHKKHLDEILLKLFGK